MVEKLKVAWQRFKEWLFATRQRAQYVLVDKGLPAAAVKPVPKHLHQTAADKLNWLCYRYKGSYKILRPNDGCLVLFVHQDGHTVTSSGLASSTAKAVGQLEAKLEKMDAN